MTTFYILEWVCLLRGMDWMLKYVRLNAMCSCRALTDLFFPINLKIQIM